MLAFAKDITQNKLEHPQEAANSELKEYLDYLRKLNHERIIFHSLDHAKIELQQNIQNAGGNAESLKEYVQQAFPFSHPFGSPDTLMLMLRKLLNSHNSSNNWYRMNPYYYTLVYDCMKRFVEFYNELIREGSEQLNEYSISEGMEIDFDDWVFLFFPNLDFHIGSELDNAQYPFAQRNKAIEEEIGKKMEGGCSREKALQALKSEFEIDGLSIKVLLGKEINEKDLELFYTSVDNPIYEYMTEKQEGKWESLDGETLMDQAYSLGSHLKVWVWTKRNQ